MLVFIVQLFVSLFEWKYYFHVDICLLDVYYCRTKFLGNAWRLKIAPVAIKAP